MKLFTLKEREGLLKDELRRIIEVIKREYDPEKIILFGSMAVNNVREWSDIDLLIRLNFSVIRFLGFGAR